MTRTKWVYALAAVMVLLPAFVSAMTAKKALPSADGKMVWEYLTKTNPYQDWELWPGKEKLYKGQHPHGAFLTTYVCKPAARAITEKAGKLPEGAMVVKENYSPEKTLAAITVMYRIKGYNPEAGDWYWAKYGADGTIQKEGKVDGCINCHNAAQANDWLFTGPVK